MPAGQIGPLPDRFPGGRVQTGRPVAAKIHIDPPRLDHRRGRGVTVHAVAQRLRLVGMKQFPIEPHLAALGIQAEDEEIVSVLGGRGQPDLAAHHHRRGPAAIRDRRLPLHILRLAPVERQSGRLRILGRRGMTVAERPAKLRPILSSRKGREQQQQTDQAIGESHHHVFRGASNFTMIYLTPSDVDRRNTSPFGIRLKFLVDTVLDQFLKGVPTRPGGIVRFLRLQRQHAAQIRDCLVVDQTFRTARGCVERNHSVCLKTARQRSKRRSPQSDGGRPRLRDRPRSTRKKTMPIRAKMKSRWLPIPCSSPLSCSWLFLVIFGFHPGQDRFSTCLRIFPGKARRPNPPAEGAAGVCRSLAPLPLNTTETGKPFTRRLRLLRKLFA